MPPQELNEASEFYMLAVKGIILSGLDRFSEEILELCLKGCANLVQPFPPERALPTSIPRRCESNAKLRAGCSFLTASGKAREIEPRKLE